VQTISHPPVRFHIRAQGERLSEGECDSLTLSSIADAGAVPLSTTTDAVGVYGGDSARRSIETEEVKRLLEEEIAERNGAAGAYTDPGAIVRLQREARLIREYLASV
jgi:hypothetical protein